MFNQPSLPFDPRFAQQPYQPMQPYQPYPQASQTPQAYTPMEPGHQQMPQQINPQFQALKAPVLQAIGPWVQYGMKEAQHTSVPHAMTEVAAITYLIGKGYDPKIAHYIVESWEKHEHF